MKKFTSYFIFLFAILVGVLFLYSYGNGTQLEKFDIATSLQEQSHSITKNHHSVGFPLSVADLTIEDSISSVKYDLKSGVILFLSLAFTIGLVVFTNHDWSNRFINLNRLILERSAPKYLLFHSFKLYF